MRSGARPATSSPRACGRVSGSHMTRSLVVEWGPDGIRVNGVLPWFTRTEMVKKVLEDAAFEQELIAATPLGRLAEPASSCVTRSPPLRRQG